MSERCNYLRRLIFAFFKDKGVMPTLIKAHYEFWCRAKMEKDAIQCIEYRADGDWYFEGIRVEQTRDVHAAQCSTVDADAKSNA
jgi:hypothetical protein